MNNPESYISMPAGEVVERCNKALKEIDDYIKCQSTKIYLDWVNKINNNWWRKLWGLRRNFTVEDAAFHFSDENWKDYWSNNPIWSLNDRYSFRRLLTREILGMAVCAMESPGDPYRSAPGMKLGVVNISRSEFSSLNF